MLVVVKTKMAKKKILVVEDDKDIQDSVVELLESEGFETICANNGREALQILKDTAQNLPDLIILDLMMPVMDGFEFREEQKRDPRIANVPIVIMSADGNIEPKKHKIDAKAYIKKPLDVDDLMELVKQHAV